MRTKTTTSTKGVLLVVIGLAGCALSPRLDEQFGEAVRTTTAAQTIQSPDASEASAPPARLDGKAANGVVDRYHRSFDQPPAASLGGVGAGGAGFIPR